MIKKLFGMVKRLFVKEVQAEESFVEESVNEKKVVVVPRRDFISRVDELVKDFEVSPMKVEEEPPVKKRVAVQSPKMSWEQFKAYNNQVNSYLDKRVHSVSA